MSEINTDVVVVGAGPGGYVAAFRAADLGLETTLVDTRERPGGVCLYVGCIPSKALLFVSELMEETRQAKAFGIHFERPRVDLDSLREWKSDVVGKLTSGLSELCRRRGITYVQARAELESPQALRLPDSEVSRIGFRHAILATGSRPLGIAGIEVESEKVMDSTAALELEEIPETLLVVGGGYIGLELGMVYAALGSKTALVEMTGGLLPGVDRDLVRPLERRIRELFESVHLKTRVTDMKVTSQEVKVTYEGNIDKNNQVFDKVLFSVGRRPNSDGLGLETTRVETDGQGFIRIDESCRTSEARIFAIGDVAGQPMLAHKAMRQGKVAAEVIAGKTSGLRQPGCPSSCFHGSGGCLVWSDRDGGQTGRFGGQGDPLPLGRFGKSGHPGAIGWPDQNGFGSRGWPGPGCGDYRAGRRRVDRRGRSGDRNGRHRRGSGFCHPHPSNLERDPGGGGRSLSRYNHTHVPEVSLAVPPEHQKTAPLRRR